MKNPFTIAPIVAMQLKELEAKKNELKKSVYKKQFNAAMRALSRNKAFMGLLMSSIKSSEDEVIVKEREAIAIVVKNMFIFGRIALITLLTGIVLFIVPVDDMYGLYCMIAMAAAIPFIIYNGSRVGVHIENCMRRYLELYEVVADDDAAIERLNMDRLIELFDIKFSKVDSISVEELSEDLKCGCYSCMSIFPSSELHSVSEGSEYTCPHCGKTTVISERCGSEITKELLEDMHRFFS